MSLVGPFIVRTDNGNTLLTVKYYENRGTIDNVIIFPEIYHVLLVVFDRYFSLSLKQLLHP